MMDAETRKTYGIMGPVLALNEGLIHKHTSEADVAFFDPSRFSWVADVERRWPLIRAELDALLAHKTRIPAFQDVSRLQDELTRDQRWRTFFFKVYGWEIEPARAQCPQTAAAIDLIPGASLAMFSILEPGKRVPFHRGPHKGVLRYHLAIKVPSSDLERCGISVKGERRPWHEGSSLVFDDTHQHAAWNETDQDRVVLFVDFPRPLPQPLAGANWLVGKVAQYLSPDVHETRIKSGRSARQLRAAR